MAATGFTPVYLYASGTAGHIPLAANLTNTTNGSEIALNYADGNLFFKNASNSVITTPLLQASGSQSGWLSSTDWTTFNNKGSGTVTSVTGTSPVASSGGTTPAISLASGYGDTQNPYASKTQNYFLAAPNGSAGVPTFRAIVAADIPTLNQNTSGTAAGLSATLAVTSGGTGTATAFTAGSAIFAGASGVYSQNNAQYFWDNTNYRLGIGTTSPDARLTIQESGNAKISFRYGDGSAKAFANFEGTGFTFQLGTVGGDPCDIFTNNARVARFFSSGGVSIGNTTDPGAANLSVTGNVVIATSGKGIDFSATAGTGTSELLADYEEGTWTPTLSSQTGSITSYTSSGTYTKVGRNVTIQFIATITNAGTGAGAVFIGGLPYTTTAEAVGCGRENVNTGSMLQLYSSSGATTATLRTYANLTPIATNSAYLITMTYQA